MFLMSCSINFLDTVDEYVYLGHCHNYNLDNSEDMKIKLNKFYSSFHTDLEILLN